MTFTPVSPDDHALIDQVADIVNTANAVDDTTRPTYLPAAAEGWMRYGWDLEVGQTYLYTPDGSDRPVGVMDLHLPQRENRHLAFIGGQVLPEHRRRGHGTAMLAEALRHVREAGRTTVWLTVGAANDYALAFAERNGFVAASQDARRRQILADIDWAEIDQLEARAREAAADYRLERLRPPLPDEILADLTDVTAAINDAPMGDLTYEEETFDVDGLRRQDQAAEGRRDRVYRVVARHRETGEAAGHTRMLINPADPVHAFQADTAVARSHRGHRLGLWLKIDMLRWLRDSEPQVVHVDTGNQVTNAYMINVNEAIGYRLVYVTTTFQQVLPAD